MIGNARGVVVLVCFLLLSCALPHGPAKERFSLSMPPPIETLPYKDADRSAQRRAWIEQMHRSAPDVDWREIDGHYRGEAMQRRQQARDEVLLREGESARLNRVDLPGPWLAEWVERGSDNQSGRIVGADYDPVSGRLLAYAHGGQLWAASRTALDWDSLNDAVQFRPSGTGGSFARLPGRGSRLLVVSDQPRGVYYSDNNGVSWRPSDGFATSNASSAHGLAVRGPHGSEIYVLRHEINPAVSASRPRLYASSDRGEQFEPIAFVGSENNRAALFAPRHDSDEVYLLADATIHRLQPGSHQPEVLATLPITPSDLANRRVLLSGGVDEHGATFLYAFYSLSGTSTLGTARVFRSLDGGLNWSERNQVPTGAFSFNSAAASTRDPDLVYLGGVEMYRSINGGSNWVRVNTWQAYYNDPEFRLHADIPGIEVFRDGDIERVLISTDGGLYESVDGAATVRNLSMQGLRVSQYYGTYTVRTPPYAILAGAQDQGFQKAAAQGEGVLDFVQTISGDYGHLTSGNGGTTLWSNYPGFTMLDLAPQAMNQSGIRMWSFVNNSFTGWLFLAPMIAHPHAPDRVSLAGGRLGGGSSHRIIELRWNGAAFVATQSSQDFGSQITALAIDPRQPDLRYAVTSARRFFRSTDGGASWTETASNLPQNHNFWGQRILIDPVQRNRVYVSGSGYSNPPVFVSDDAGDSFQPFSSGLPSTLVFDLAASADGEHLFAASEVGPFYYDRGAQTWRDITGLNGPAQTFWQVDFVDELGLARFATYGRGIWDLVLSDDRLFVDGFEP